MIRTLTLAAVAALALAACNKKDSTIEAGPADPMANEIANAGPVELPPAIAASKTYRCKDNSVVYIDWFAENKGANFKTEATGTPTKLTPDANGALVAEGYKLIGLPTASTITLERPGKGSQAC